MICGCPSQQRDYGPCPYVANLELIAEQNQDFRRAAWTGDSLQMTLMCIPVNGSIGMEIHEDTDQLIRVERGSALVKMGECKGKWDICRNLHCGDGVFVPAGTWHNVINTGMEALKVSSVYAPPHHPRGIVQPMKADRQ